MEWALVALGALGFAILYSWLGPLVPVEEPADDTPCGYLTDGVAVWPLRGLSVIIGRGPTADIDLDEPRANRIHAELRVVSGSVLLRDLGSRHGTSCNGRRLDRTVALVDGDAITIGGTVLTYQTTARADAWLSDGSSVYPLRTRLLIGRGSDNDIEIHDRAASWLHAEVRRVPEGAAVHDLWSAHGTLLNGQRLTRWAVLADGDEMTIGSTVLSYRTVESLAGAPLTAA